MKFLILTTKAILIIGLLTGLAYYQQWLFTMVFATIYGLYNLFNEFVTVTTIKSCNMLIQANEHDKEMFQYIMSNTEKELH